MTDTPTLCPDCGEPPDLWTADGHCVAVRCTELAALQQREERAEAALHTILGGAIGRRDCRHGFYRHMPYAEIAELAREALDRNLAAVPEEPT